MTAICNKSGRNGSLEVLCRERFRETGTSLHSLLYALLNWPCIPQLLIKSRSNAQNELRHEKHQHRWNRPYHLYQYPPKCQDKLVHKFVMAWKVYVCITSKRIN